MCPKRRTKLSREEKEALAKEVGMTSEQLKFLEQVIREMAKEFGPFEDEDHFKRKLLESGRAREIGDGFFSFRGQ
jgi:non-homologous end joining protein Ku